MRLGVLAIVASATATLLPIPAAAQVAGQPRLSPDERAILHEIAECKADATPDYCAPFKLLFAHMLAAPAPPPPSETAASVRETMATFQEGQALDAARRGSHAEANSVASGHGAGPAGQTLPAKGKGVTVDLAATTDTKNASVTLTVDLGAKSNDVTTSLSFTAQAPIGQDQSYQNVATLDGLSKSTSIGFQYNWLKIKDTSQATSQNTPYYQDTCHALLREIAAADPSAKIQPIWYKDNACGAGDLADLVDKDTALGDLKPKLAAAIETLRQTGIPTIDSVWFVSTNGKVGYEQHTFFDGTSLAKSTLDRTPWQVGLAGSYVFKGGYRSVTLSYNYQRSYEDGGKDGKMQTLCPTTGTPVLKCVAGYINAPLRKDKDLFALDYRYISPLGAFPIPIGIDPGVTYDANSGAYGFQLPFYVIVDKSKNLTGGLRYDWTSDKHESVVGIFVTSGFCILPGYSGCSTGGSSDKAGKGGGGS